MFSQNFLQRICLLSVFLLSGCDQINSFFNKNKASESPAPVSAPVVENSNAAKPMVEPSAAPMAPNVLAKVGSWTITQEEFAERLKNLKEIVPDFDPTKVENKTLILEELVRQQLLVLDAEQAGLGNKKEIAEAVEEFRKSLLVRESAMKLTQGIQVTDQEAQEFYDQNKAALTEPGEYKVREIVLSTQQGAKDLLVEVLKGADFVETAKARSKGKTAAAGGDLGWVKTFEFPQMEAAIVSMEPGDTSNVVKGPTGDYYIYKLDEKKGGKQKEFTEVKKDIVDYLTQLKQQDAIVKYLESLKQKYPVKVNEDLLKN